MRISRLLPVLAVSACGAAATTPPDASIACGEPRVYQIDHVHFPTSFAEVAAQGLDLDGDGRADNALGSLTYAVSALNPDVGDLDAKAAARLAGETTWRLEVRACDDGQHLAIGDSGGGDAVPITILVDPVGDFTPVAWVRVGRVAGKLALTDDSADGVIGFAIPVPDAAHAVLAPMAAYLSAELAAGKSPVAASMDVDHDGAVSVGELQASGWATRVANDLARDADGAAGMSAGVQLHAHRVTP